MGDGGMCGGPRGTRRVEAAAPRAAYGERAARPPSRVQEQAADISAATPVILFLGFPHEGFFPSFNEVIAQS